MNRIWNTGSDIAQNLSHKSVVVAISSERRPTLIGITLGWSHDLLSWGAIGSLVAALVVG